MSALKYLLWFTTRQGLWPGAATALLQHFGTAEAAYFADPSEYDGLPVSGGTKEALRDKNLDGAERVLAAHPYDFVLGSQHKLGDEVDYYFYDYTHVDVGEAMDRYFDATLELVKWGRFHSLAHLTYPFRYIPAEKRPADYSRWQDRIDAVFRALRDRDIALEINVSGLRNPLVNSAHPDLPLVRRFRELGGEKITVGADAHRPEDVGAHIRDGLLIAREAGFRYTAVYFGGRAEMCAIEL